MEKKITNNIYFCLLHTFNYLSFFFFHFFFFTFDSQLCLLAFAIVYRLTQVANLVYSHLFAFKLACHSAYASCG